MPSDYLKGLGTRETPQSEAIPGAGQVPNSAGGFAWELDRWGRLERFLILGSEGGTYYVSERKLTLENAAALRECLVEDGPRVVETVRTISKDGRAPKNTPAIFALAVALGEGDARTKRAAQAAVTDVCRTGTHLFQFAELVQEHRGWGRSLRRAVAGWYTRDVDTVAYQAVKYRQREGWTHRDLLRLAHPKAQSHAQAALFDWIVRRGNEDVPRAVEAFERAQSAKTPRDTVALIGEYGNLLPREALQTDHLNAEVWEALIAADMPMTALVRNLGTLTRLGVLKPLGSTTKLVIDQLHDGERIRRARVHPLAVLIAERTYQSGGGWRSGNTWRPVGAVVDALDDAFYLAFGNVRPSGKRTLLALDVSGSMATSEVAGAPGLTPRDASAAMALVTAASEPSHAFVAFTNGDRPSRWYGSNIGSGLTPLNISPRQRLDDVIGVVSRLEMGGTDCALPMLHATEQGLEVDTFVIYTDSETWFGTPHPSQALRQYRERSGIPAKLVVVGMEANSFTIADPRDAGMLDVVGFDTATPDLISMFSAA